MTAITFPASPYQYQVYTVGSKSWQWDGSYWVSYYNESPDIVYGNGYDGDKTLDGTTTLTLGDSTTIVPSSSVYSLTQDVYFNDLTISASVSIRPNGYRIFVKNILKFNNNSTIGFNTGYSTAGSIQQGGAAITSVTHSLGGAGASSPPGTVYTATAPTAALGGTKYFRVAQQAVTGYSITASGGPTFLRGGAGGTSQAGGGVVIVAARYISGPSSGTGYIKAPATAPAGGGVIIVVSSASALPASISTDVTGQNSGTYIYIQQV
jgi:hypothetical protein